MNQIPEGYEELPPDDQTVGNVKDCKPEIERLAALDGIEYDRERKASAIKLGIRIDTLDAEVKKHRPALESVGNDRAITWPEVNPWPEPVDGDDLLSNIARTIRQYVVLSKMQADAIALWVVMTWVHDRLEVAPFMNVTSAVKRSGKSTLADVLGALVYRPLATSGRITAAPLFRLIERDGPTLILDEADTFMRDDPELAGIINGSQRRSAAYVIRCEGDKFEPVRFSTWSPKAILGIGNLPDTVTDRSIVINLERKSAGEQITLWRHRDRAAISELQSKIARWVEDRRGAIISNLPAVAFPSGLDDRQQDSWEPLIAIAEAASGDWPERAQHACTGLCASSDDKESVKELLLADLSTLFEVKGNPDALETVDILAYLNNRDDRPWPEWSPGKEMSARALASQLRSFKIAPATVRISADRTAKGYKREAFLEAWSRYVSPALSVTTSQPREIRDFSRSQSVTREENVTDRKPLKPMLTTDCDVVTDRITLESGNTTLSDIERARLATHEDDDEERAAIQDDGMDIPDFLIRPIAGRV